MEGVKGKRRNKERWNGESQTEQMETDGTEKDGR